MNCACLLDIDTGADTRDDPCGMVRTGDRGLERRPMIRSSCIMSCLFIELLASSAYVSRVVNEPSSMSDLRTKTDVEGARYHPNMR